MPSNATNAVIVGTLLLTGVSAYYLVGKQQIHGKACIPWRDYADLPPHDGKVTACSAETLQVEYPDGTWTTSEMLVDWRAALEAGAWSTIASGSNVGGRGEGILLDHAERKALVTCAAMLLEARVTVKCSTREDPKGRLGAKLRAQYAENRSVATPPRPRLEVSPSDGETAAAEPASHDLAPTEESAGASGDSTKENPPEAPPAEAP